MRVERVSDSVLAFRSRYRVLHSRRAGDSLEFLAYGEIDVAENADGLSISLRANPHVWDSFFIILPFMVVAGWSSALELLRWGAGFGGVLLGGVSLGLTWGNLSLFLANKAGTFKMLRTRASEPR